MKKIIGMLCAVLAVCPAALGYIHTFVNATLYPVEFDVNYTAWTTKTFSLAPGDSHRQDALGYTISSVTARVTESQAYTPGAQFQSQVRQINASSYHGPFAGNGVWFVGGPELGAAGKPNIYEITRHCL